ncbi:helix-turn-helix domain-containing protein [Thalassococcus lentus]|uniref:AraC family transcriptional regulator ligand-binding domain-containing protein n=1 Tax=Thalassococcus lentus TaxID=1210524 RepID=A0ABT4XPT2_9RHOB|nr:AraC family transcriptional regulator [Thalassococcus lentus]MDA7423964.1 AraC family transcriptional regulator ligand-binding domain-containing protein [Thalassococcus lentus]
MTQDRPTILSTVSSQFIEDWLIALRALCSDAQYKSLIQRSDLIAETGQLYGRVTLDQIVCLYQLAAVETGDEMMGLWSRPIRPRALQHLLTSVREARSLPAALYRFSTFWNLLLDDYQFRLTETDNLVQLHLHPHDKAPVQRFGHMLILKLAHGLLSWLAGHEVPIKGVDFVFDRPDFDQDYAIIFPAAIQFGQANTCMTFDPSAFGPVEPRSPADLNDFLKNAPRDWVFTSSREHTQSLRVRTLLSQSDWSDATLERTARVMNMTPRTLIRRLDADGTSFQGIKDALRRDIAIRDLQSGFKSVETIAQGVGFSSAANFHRAFQRWTGSTPTSYRRSFRKR